MHRLAERRAGIRPPIVAPPGRPMAVVSTHLDDAVLSCAQVLAANPGAVVVTVFSGGPDHWEQLTQWDADCGFRTGQDAIAARKAEDVLALAVLGARPRWVDLPEEQYGRPVTQEEVDDALRAGLADAAPGTVVLAPVGVHHADHVLLGNAAVRLLAERPDLEWLLYEDLPYGSHHPDELAARLAELRAGGLRLEPHDGLGSAPVAWKRAAMRRYRSQVRGLHEWIGPAVRDGAERYWRPVAADQ